jgi:hypothetical protein
VASAQVGLLLDEFRDNEQDADELRRLAAVTCSFLFYPAKPEKSETEAFTAHFNACAVSAANKMNHYKLFVYNSTLLSIATALLEFC